MGVGNSWHEADTLARLAVAAAAMIDDPEAGWAQEERDPIRRGRLRRFARALRAAAITVR